MAMQAIKLGKHVYCEKPLAHSIHEVRALMKAARDHNVITYDELRELERSGLFRTAASPSPPDATSLCSNDYLGLAEIALDRVERFWSAPWNRDIVLLISAVVIVGALIGWASGLLG